LPEILGKDVVRQVAIFQYLRGVIDSIIEQKDVDAVSLRIGKLLDISVVVNSSKTPGIQQEDPRYLPIKKGRS
jgi:type I restriction enzyme R subunit